MMFDYNSIETCGLVDGPGIRTVIFLNKCLLRCKFCHNPEMWQKQKKLISEDELLNIVKKYKGYYKDNGGVTFSGGEPILQSKAIISFAKKAHNEGINIAIDTAGVSNENAKELLDNIDLVLLDIKHIYDEAYKELTGLDIKYFNEFVKVLNNSNKPVWIRQVIIPNYNDNILYIEKLHEYLKKIKNIKKVEFLPYHSMATSKYDKLGIPYPLKDLSNMDKDKVEELHNYFMNIKK